MLDSTPLLSGTGNDGAALPRLPIARMYFLGVIVVTPSILAGMSLSYSAVALPKMNLDVSHTSWFSSISQLVAPLGSLLTGVVIDTRGRRYALIVSMIPSILGWLCLYWNCNIPVIYAGRFLTGINVGANYYPSQAYANECIMVNSEKMRRSFMAWTGISFTLGTFLTYLLGYFLSYLQISLIATVLSVIVTFLLIFFLPESPTWLYFNHRVDEAKSSERKLGIYQPVLHSDDVDIADAPFTWGWSTIEIGLKKLARSDVYHPLITYSFLFFILTATGGPLLIGYTVDIIGGDSSTSYLYSVASGAILVGSNVLTCFAVHYFRVKTLATYSSLVMAIGMALIAYTTLNKASDLSGLHLAAVWLTTFAYGFCLSSQPRMLLGQVFPMDAKGFASVPSIVVSLVAGSLNKVHPYFQLLFGGCEYYIYAVICLVNAACMYVFIPHSVDESLRQRRKLSSL